MSGPLTWLRRWLWVTSARPARDYAHRPAFPSAGQRDHHCSGRATLRAASWDSILGRRVVGRQRGNERDTEPGRLTASRPKTGGWGVMKRKEPPVSTLHRNARPYEMVSPVRPSFSFFRESETVRATEPSARWGIRSAAGARSSCRASTWPVWIPTTPCATAASAGRWPRRPR